MVHILLKHGFIQNAYIVQSFVGHGESINEIRTQALKPSLVVSASKVFPSTFNDHEMHALRFVSSDVWVGILTG